MYIRKDDIGGSARPATTRARAARCSASSATKNKVVVEGVNRVYRHLKPSPPQPAGRPALEGDAGRRLERRAHRPDARTSRPASASATWPTARKELFAKKSGTAHPHARRRPNPKYAEEEVTPSPRTGPVGMRPPVGRSTGIDDDGREPTTSRNARHGPAARASTRRRSSRRSARSSAATNVLSLPKLQKIVLNMGVGKALQDKNRMKQAAEQLGADRRAEAADHEGQDGRSAGSASARGTRSAAG